MDTGYTFAYLYIKCNGTLIVVTIIWIEICGFPNVEQSRRSCSLRKFNDGSVNLNGNNINKRKFTTIRYGKVAHDDVVKYKWVYIYIRKEI